MKRRTLASLLVVGLLVGLGSMGGCTSPIPNRVPVGETFPTVEAEPLDAASRDDWETIPGDFAGSPLLLLVGYVQDTQFDIDRWLFGVLDADLDVTLREVPAARGMAARATSMLPGIVPGWEWKEQGDGRDHDRGACSDGDGGVIDTAGLRGARSVGAEAAETWIKATI